MTRSHAAQADDNGTEGAETAAVESPVAPAPHAASLEDRVAALEKTVARLAPLIGEP
jgi:hypothetical protein